MKLWLIYPKPGKIRNIVDYFAEAVVVAKSEEDAKKIHPDGKILKWGDDGGAWVNSPKDVEAKLIGTAYKSLKEGTIITSSFCGY